MEAIAYYPGSCGEIVQGKVRGMDLLISCPVNLYTKVRIFESHEPFNRYNYEKTHNLLKSLAFKWGFNKEALNMDFEVTSQIPRGKGFASSTADLCAAYYAFTKLFNLKPSIEELIEECIKIEPTDSIIFDRLTLFDYKNGSYYEDIMEYKEFYLLVFEGSKIVDTVSFNNSNKPELENIEDLLSLVKGGKIKDIAKASTMSILRNQKRIEYRVLDEVLKIKDTTGGLGIMGGHSGDILAIIYDDIEGFKNSLKYDYKINGYRVYPIKTLRSVTYEDNNDCSPIKW